MTGIKSFWLGAVLIGAGQIFGHHHDLPVRKAFYAPGTIVAQANAPGDSARRMGGGSTAPSRAGGGKEARNEGLSNAPPQIDTAGAGEDSSLPTGSADSAAQRQADPDTGKGESAAPQPPPTFLAKFNSWAFSVLFFDLSFGAFERDKVDFSGRPVLDEGGAPVTMPVEVPLLVVVLLLGGLFFTFFYKWINIRAFRHALAVVAGKFDRDDHQGEISHFRALTSALSATIGLGNIAGVAIAIQLGGPGAVFWMIVTAVFGMSLKFNSCTLSQLYRKYNPDGSISGGPMYYLDIGLRKLGGGWAPFGKVLAVMYGVMIMGGAVGGGNMFQVNQTVEAFSDTFGLGDGAGWAIGILMVVMVGMVILGGIRRIGYATSRVVPAMCLLYVGASVFIILSNLSQLPHALALILKMAFTENAFYGGFVGVLVWGIKRAAFSNEAGLGSAAIAHAAARTDEPVREGLVAMLGPFIDTIIVCLMTAMVVIITGAWNDPAIPQSAGVALTTSAFGKEIAWFPYILTACIGLFAYSTMISWCYYGERGWIYLFDHFGGLGLRTVVVFRILFLAFILVGALNPLSEVLDFSDVMILSMAFPNILGSIFLAPTVARLLKDYMHRLHSGQMLPTR